MKKKGILAVALSFMMVLDFRPVQVRKVKSLSPIIPRRIG